MQNNRSLCPCSSATVGMLVTSEEAALGEHVTTQWLGAQRGHISVFRHLHKIKKLTKHQVSFPGFIPSYIVKLSKF